MYTIRKATSCCCPPVNIDPMVRYLVQHNFLPINTILYKTIYQIKWAGSLRNFLQHTHIHVCYNDHWYSTLKDYTVLLCVRSPAITRSNAELLSIWPPNTTFRDIWMRFKQFSLKKMEFKMPTKGPSVCTNVPMGWYTDDITKPFLMSAERNAAIIWS